MKTCGIAGRDAGRSEICPTSHQGLWGRLSTCGRLAIGHHGWVQLCATEVIS
jgi:hypothetical protein